MKIKLKRVYEQPEADDGYRVLVDRLWPRGIKKEALKMDEWAQDFSPPSQLRNAYHHGEMDFVHFRHAYLTYLNNHPDKETFLKRMHVTLEGRQVTLLSAAKHTDNNHATVLRDWILENNR